MTDLRVARTGLSLRRYLLLGILIPIAVFMLIDTVTLYRQALAAVNTAYDRTLLASAKSIGELLGSKPRKRDAMAVLSWAFRSWKAQRSEEFDKALKKAGLLVPRAEGTLGKAATVFFSADGETRGQGGIS